MRRAILIAGMANCIPDIDGDYFGIDRGALIALRCNRPLLGAIGDFDSINEEERVEIASQCPMLTLSSHKNETDSEAAIAYVLSLGYEAVILYGCLGGRLDHELANLRLMTQRDYPLMLMDEYNQIEVLKPGEYHIAKVHQYLSFLALEPSCISETCVAYPLHKQMIDMQDIYMISNEIEKVASITIHSGKVLMMQCSDHHL